jgi:hypothetical protein
MSERRRVSTVEEALDALVQGEQVELWPKRPDYVPGAGFDASPEAKEALWLLQQHGFLEFVSRATKRGPGQPKLGSRLSVHARRALLAWYVFHHVMEKPQPSRVTNSDVIRAAREMEQSGGPVGERLFLSRGHVGESGLEQSLSRGRTELGIGADWESDFCKEFWGNSLQ